MDDPVYGYNFWLETDGTYTVQIKFADFPSGPPKKGFSSFEEADEWAIKTCQKLNCESFAK